MASFSPPLRARTSGTVIFSPMMTPLSPPAGLGDVVWLVSHLWWTSAARRVARARAAWVWAEVYPAVWRETQTRRGSDLRRRDAPGPGDVGCLVDRLPGRLDDHRTFDGANDRS